MVHGGSSHVGNVLELGQKPPVNFTQLEDGFNVVAAFERGLNGEEAGVRGLADLDLLLKGNFLIDEVGVVSLNSRKRLVHHPASLLNDLFEVSSNSHDLTNGKHRRSEGLVDPVKLLQVPPRHLKDAVVKGWLKAGGGGLGDGVAETNEVLTKGELGGNVGERVTGGFGSKGGGSRETGVDLDDAVALALGVQGVLDVALSNDSKVANDLNSGPPKHEVLPVGECLGRCDNDTVTSVDAEGVEILHVTNRDTVVPAVPDDFVLDLLPAAEVLVDEDLVGSGESLLGELHELVIVGGEARSEPSKGKCSTDEDGVADFVRSLLGLLDVGGRVG
mmetsp:Transcript_788/g.1341  ORF Transcript_788/g.1341 Transcript_788/m.1341 type:complete len:332 (+) Transcript_788:1885-2880(+)